MLYTKKGSALIIVLMIMMIVSVLSVTAASIIYNHYLIMRNEVRYQQTYYLAETGLNCAYEDMVKAIYEVHRDIKDEYVYNPLINPTDSIQQNLRRYMNTKLGLTLRNTLRDKEILSNNYIHDQVFSEMLSQGHITVKITLESHFNNPMKFLISSVGKIGKIERRMDAHLRVHKVSMLYDSILLDKTIVTGAPIYVKYGGVFIVVGDVYPTQGVSLVSSLFSIDGSLYTQNNLLITEAARALITGDVIAGDVIVDVDSLAELYCQGDVYLFSDLDLLLIEDDEIEDKMLQLSAWDYRHHYDITSQVATRNATLIDDVLEVTDDEMPIIFTHLDNSDISLDSGNYRGFLYTAGSLIVKEGDEVVFDGLIIADGGIMVYGSLSVTHNKELIVRFMEDDGESLMNFFKIIKELPLIEVTSWRERAVNLRY